VRYMDIEEQVDADFTSARRRAFVRRMGARLRGDSTRTGLRSFEKIRKVEGAYNRVRLGTNAVPVGKIVGSVGRHQDFDATFMPAKSSLRARWKRIDRAFHRGEDLPPVALHKLGDEYFVEDGNHRVSVARFHAVEWIDADVMYSRVPETRVGQSGAEPATADLPTAA
jgi:hypothetical protein